MKWLLALLLTCSTLTAQVAGVALYLQYQPPPPPPPPPPVFIAQTNYVPNSSFELGASRGWISYGNSAANKGNVSSTSGFVVTNDSVHGSNCMSWVTRLISRPMYLSNGNYTLTYSMKGTNAFTAFWTNVSDNFEAPGVVPISVTTSWQRYTNSWVCPSNGYYAIKFYEVNGVMGKVDAVQLERATTATPYAPSSPVEFGLTTTDIHNSLYAGDTKQFQVKWWNDSTAQVAVASYTLYDMWYSNVVTAAVSSAALAPGSTTVNVPVTRSGWMRIMAHQPTLNDSWDELTMAVFPYATSTSFDTNGLLATHPEWGPYSLQRERRLGYTMGRDLSPGIIVRWSLIQPAPGPFLWNATSADAAVSSYTTNGLVPLLCLTPGDDFIWPSWAVTNMGAGVVASILDYSNYCWAVANRYSPAPSNCWYYEIGNEPHNLKPPGCPTDFEGGVAGTLSYSLAASNRARFMIAGAQAVKAVNPNLTVLGIAGENIASRAWATWTNTTVDERTNINVISAHLYPLNQGSVQPNLAEDDIGVSQSSLAWKILFGGVGKPYWVTEMGAQGQNGGYRGGVVLNAWGFQPYGVMNPEAGRNWKLDRQIVSVDRECRQFIRLFGNGFSKAFLYTSRGFDDVNFGPNYKAGNAEFSGSPKVASVGTLIAANHFIRNPGLGRITNSAIGNLVEAYYFTNQLGTTVGIWSADNIERTFTVSDARIGVFDIHGNLIQTNSAVFRIGRTPEFIVSGTITTAGLRSIIENALVATVTDTQGPNITIDVSPIGAIPVGSTNFFKWSQLDRNMQPWSIGSFSPHHTNILSRIKFAVADPWIDVGASNHFYKAFSVVGATNRIYVEAKDFYNNRTTNEGPAIISY